MRADADRGVGYLRFAVLALGLPTLIVWASREQALGWDRGWNESLLAGLVVSQCGLAIYALRFRVVMRIVGIELGWLETLRLIMLALFYQFFVPFSVGADLTKYIKLKPHGEGAFLRAGGIVLDHLVGLTALLVIAFSLFAWRHPIEVEPGALGGVLLAVLAGATLVAFAVRRRRAVDAAMLLRVIVSRRRSFIVAVLLSQLMHLVGAAAIFCGSHGWDLGVDYLDILFVMTAALVFQAVPVGVAGVGMAELAGTGLYLAVGLPMPAAILLVSLLYGYRLFAAVAGGLWDLLPAPRAASGDTGLR